jgi:hypothetical protein
MPQGRGTTILCFPDRRLDVVELRTQSASVFFAGSLGGRGGASHCQIGDCVFEVFEVHVLRVPTISGEDGELQRRAKMATLSRTRRQRSQPASTSTRTRHSNSIPACSHLRHCSANYTALVQNPRTTINPNPPTCFEPYSSRIKHPSKNDSFRVEIPWIRNCSICRSKSEPRIVTAL